MTKLLAAVFGATVFSGCAMTSLGDGVPAGEWAPDLPAAEWLNAAMPIQRADLDGSPVLIEFWSVDCPPCVRSIPKVKRIRDAYAPMGLKVVTVHVSLDLENPGQDATELAASLDALGVDYPVGVDQAAASWETFEFRLGW